MSRIHEALKKAEEQRAASQGGHAEPAGMVEGVATEPGAAVAPGVGSASSATAPAAPSFASPFSFDTLLARCAQSHWAPDAKTMLFFNAEEQGYGTEDFRTLRSRLYQMREKQTLKKLLVTSALPKEGKILCRRESGTGDGTPARSAG